MIIKNNPILQFVIRYLLASLRLSRSGPYAICLLFAIAYSVLSIVKHDHFLSGYDLAVSDQGIWLMSQFKNPISTPHAYAFTSLFSDHVEIIYGLLSPIYWIANDVRILIALQAFAISFSALPIFFIAKMKKLKPILSYSILTSFLLFYGIQNAIWADVHSLVFAASFLPWFIYFIEKKNTKWMTIFFILLLSCKEDIALLTFLLAGIYYLKTKWRPLIYIMGGSVGYILLIFYIYFPHFTKDGYRFQNENGLLSNIDLRNFYDTAAKRDVIIYSLAWFGFLPLLAPLFVIPVLADIGHYFVLGSDYVTSAQSIFLHYRVTLATLLALGTIYSIVKFKKLNHWITGAYILLFALGMQYILHLPLSYFAKSWFWTKPIGAINIEKILPELPGTAAVASQNNITPHINHRENIFTLWPEKKNFSNDSPCGNPTCDWLRWPGNPEFIIVDTSTEWDTRHWLTNHDEFINALSNLEKEKRISLFKQIDTAKIYKVL